MLILKNYENRSYTPKNISVQVGMTTQDLVPAIYAASLVELNEPVGWCIIPLASPPDPLDDISEDIPESLPRSRRIVRTHLIQIEVCSMHQNGRDTHVRQGKKIYSYARVFINPGDGMK
jgi:anaphase-promoting complex subunit 10